MYSGKVLGLVFFNKSSPPGRPRANLGSNPGGDTQVRDMFAPLTIFYIADIMMCFVFLYRKHSLRKNFAVLFSVHLMTQIVTPLPTLAL